MGKKKGGNRAQGVEISWGGGDNDSKPQPSQSQPMMYQPKVKP